MAFPILTQPHGGFAVRYQVSNVERSIAFYTGALGFQLDQSMAPAFARVSRGDLDNLSIQRNLEYYALLRSMDPQQRSAAIRGNPNYFPRGSGVH